MNADEPGTAVRTATVDDVPPIYELLQRYAAMGNLLPRSEDEIFRQLRNFFVVGPPGRPLACGALEIFTAELGEVRSLMVESGYQKQGFGRRIVEHIAGKAAEQGLSRLMALTYVPEFFHRLGFRTVPKDTLPEKVWGVCIKCYRFNHCDEIAVLRHL